MKALTACALAFLAQGGAASLAQAQAPDRQVAAELVRKAIAKQDAGKIEEAVELYHKAYCLEPVPVLIYNIGTAYKAGDKPLEALRYFRLFVKTAPNAAEAVDARNAITQLSADAPPTGKSKDVAEMKCKEEDLVVDACADGSEPVDGACPATCPVGQIAKGGTCVDAPMRPPREGSSNWMRWTGIGTSITGLGVLGVGIYYGKRASDLTDDVNELLETRPSWTLDDQNRYDRLIGEGESAERNQIVFSAVGGGLALAGVVLVLVSLGGGGSGESNPSATAWTFEPIADDTQLGFRARAGF